MMTTAQQMIEQLQAMIEKHGNLVVENSDGEVFSSLEYNDDIEGQDPVFILA